jgi:hypothetical protein
MIFQSSVYDPVMLADEKRIIRRRDEDLQIFLSKEAQQEISSFPIQLG